MTLHELLQFNTYHVKGEPLTIIMFNENGTYEGMGTSNFVDKFNGERTIKEWCIVQDIIGVKLFR